MIVKNISEVLAEMQGFANAVVAHPDRNSTVERQGFINGLEALFSAMKESGHPVPHFYASMLNRLCQDDSQNAYPHFDQSFTKTGDDAGERDKRGYMERMRVLVPVALMSVLQRMGLTVAQAAHLVSHALTEAGYKWPTMDVTPARKLISWHSENTRSTKKTDKIEQLERALKIVAAEHTRICATEPQQGLRREALIKSVVAIAVQY